MRQFDLTPLYRSTVGFDRLFNVLDNVTGGENLNTGYPPYNIERLGENEYRITMAVAGFSEDELDIESRENTLTVKGNKMTEVDEAEEGRFLHQGIAARAFERRFQLADHVEATGARIENGLLHIELKRELPEAMKPRTIKIGTSGQKKISRKAA